MAQADRRESTNDPARVAVTAAGVISPLGFGLAETLESLRSAEDCVTPVMRFSVTQCRCKTAGQVSDSRLLASHAQIPRSGRLHRASHMMIQALQELVTQQPEFQPELTVVGTTSGGMSYGERYYRSLNGAGDLRHAPTWIANYPAQKPVIDAQTVFGFSAPCHVIANACASGTNAVGHAFECVRSGRYQRVVAGGYDALAEMVFVGFDSLQASTPEK
jgi:3-oxoacyl-[acyl-carrier-protein] synthase II